MPAPTNANRGQIFFIGNDFAPLDKLQAGKYTQALENVRLAPSASNKQPWRILYDGQKPIFHFYLARTTGYKILMHVSMQDIDMGIALCHFDLTVKEMGLSGIWKKSDLAPKNNSFEYIASWHENTVAV